MAAANFSNFLDFYGNRFAAMAWAARDPGKQGVQGSGECVGSHRVQKSDAGVGIGMLIGDMDYAARK